MNKQQIEVEKAKLAAEEQVLARLKKDYSQAAKTVSERIKIHDNKIEVMLKDIGKLDEAQMSILQSQIYQKRFQESLKRQIDAILDNMSKSNYKTISDYLNNCYNLGYIGTMYDLAGQGIPLSVPINQSAMLKAVTLNPKLSEKLYGGYVHQMSKHIRNEISRGIATADSYANIARNITNASKVGLNKAMRIARTEGHRIQSEAAFDAQHVAKNAGADVVKQWDSSLDGKTRETHRQLDGQIREIDEPFEVNGMEAMYPSGFGKASEDINCRCVLLQRARWALDEEELQTLKERAAKHGLIVKASKGREASKAFGQAKAKDFADYKRNFLKATEKIVSNATKNNITRLTNKRIRTAAIKPKLTDEDINAIQEYVSATAYILNDNLRNGVSLTFELEQLIKRLDNALDKMPTFEGNLTRSLWFYSEDAVETFVSRYVIGEIISYDEYLSTTKGKELYNPDGQVHLHIFNSKKGKDISTINKDEDEVLFKRGASFKVENKYKVDGKYHIILGEVDG